MNTSALTGRLTSDVELKITPSGVSVCSFCVAVKRPMTKDKTDFIDCVAWRNAAEFISKYFRKGDKIEITGTLQSRAFTDQSGTKRTKIEVVVATAEFAESKGAKNTTAAEASPAPEYVEVGEEEELPF